MRRLLLRTDNISLRRPRPGSREGRVPRIPAPGRHSGWNSPEMRVGGTECLSRGLRDARPPCSHETGAGLRHPRLEALILFLSQPRLPLSPGRHLRTSHSLLRRTDPPSLDSTRALAISSSGIVPLSSSACLSLFPSLSLRSECRRTREISLLQLVPWYRKTLITEQSADRRTPLGRDATDRE